MHSTETLQHHETEPPIETGTSWGYKIAGLLTLPIAVNAITSPAWLFNILHFGTRPNSLIASGCFVVLVGPFFVAFGVWFLVTALKCLLLRVRVDSDALYIRVLGWRQYPLNCVSARNFVTGTNEYMFVPGNFGGEDTGYPSDTRVAWRGAFSPYSIVFSMLPRQAREKILRRLHARLPRPSVATLPDSVSFRLKGPLFDKRITMDGKGLTVACLAWERRHAWDSVTELVLGRSSSKDPGFRSFRLAFDNGKSLFAFQFKRSGWGKPEPDKAVILEYLCRHVPGDRRTEVTPEIPVDSKALEWALKNRREESRIYRRISVESFFMGTAFFGALVLPLYYFSDNFGREWMLSAPFVSTAIVGFLVITCLSAMFLALSIHKLRYEIPEMEQLLREAQAREQMEGKKDYSSH